MLGLVGVNLEVRDIMGRTALAWASIVGYDEFVRMLLKETGFVA